MTHHLADEIRDRVANMEHKENGQELNREPPEHHTSDEIQDIYVLIVREREEETVNSQIVDSTPDNGSSAFVMVILVFMCCLPMLLSIAVQTYLLFNPPIATVTIYPRTQTVTMSGTLQLGRVLTPITISQSATTRTTGKGHQDAKVATGSITFYNGLFTPQTIAAGTILSGPNHIPITTDQTAYIPAANPPIFGQVSVAAHAIQSGVSGNIPSYEINQACCANAVLAKNTNPFTGGQDERSFQIVTKRDIDTTAMQLKRSLIHSTTGALQGQLKPHEQLDILPCTPTVTSDHQPGEEATVVKVTVAQTCSAVAYNQDTLTATATDLLTHQVIQKLGTGYSLIGRVQVSVKQATVTNASRLLVFVTFQAHGTWMYGFSYKAQQQIKQLIAGKPRQEALHLLLALPGITKAAIEWDENTKLPKSLSDIHFQIIIRSS